MKYVLIFFALVVCQTNYAQDLDKFRAETDELMETGNYEKALERMLLYHNQFQSSATQVKSGSFFIFFELFSLSDKYPPALDALKALRDQKSYILNENDASPSVFHDLVIINNLLKNHEQSMTLYEKLVAKHPEYKEDYNIYIEEVLFDNKAYRLIHDNFASPMVLYFKAEAAHKLGMQSSAFYKHHSKSYIEKGFAERCLRLIEYARQYGDESSISKIEKSAIPNVGPEILKLAITEELANGNGEKYLEQYVVLD